MYYISLEIARTIMDKLLSILESRSCHDDLIKWKHFRRYWSFVWGIHRSPVNSPHKGQWCGALMFSLMYAWINGWVNNREAGDLRRHRAHYDIVVMLSDFALSKHRFAWHHLWCIGTYRELSGLHNWVVFFLLNSLVTTHYGRQTPL